MLNNANSDDANQLLTILQQARHELSIIDNLDAMAWRENATMFHVVCYSLIRVGNVVALYSRQLERVYPDYPWVYWVALRNQLAHSHLANEFNPGDVYMAIESSLPGLIQAVTGQSSSFGQQL